MKTAFPASACDFAVCREMITAAGRGLPGERVAAPGDHPRGSLAPGTSG